MLGKKILAGVFAAIILLKLVVVFTYPSRWMVLSGVFLGHHLVFMGIYLVLLVITGYYIFSSLSLIDIAVVMFFTSILTGLSLIPYTSLLLSLSEQVMTVGIGKAWLATLIWGALAVMVLYKVFAKARR
jgi:inner membrane protein involved in colicin E2 resistance